MTDRETARFSGGGRSAPQPLEAAARSTGIVDSMPGVAMAEVILDETQVITFVGEREPARMTKHVRMDWRQAGASCCGVDEVVH
jgi:hypothetical protein